MTSILLALCAAVGTYLLVVARSDTCGQRTQTMSARVSPAELHRRAELALRRAGLDGVSPMQFAATVGDACGYCAFKRICPAHDDGSSILIEEKS